MIHLNKDNFDETVSAASGIVLVDFWAEWCGPCKMMSSIIDEIEAEHPEITVAKVDVDNNPEISSQYQITSIPTLIVFKEGSPAAVSVGFKPKSEIEQMINDIA